MGLESSFNMGFYTTIIRFEIAWTTAQESQKLKVTIHDMSFLWTRFVQKEFRIFMKIESHFYRNEICLTALFIPSCANAFWTSTTQNCGSSPKI